MNRTKTNEPINDFAARLVQLTREFGSRYALAKASGIPASTLQSYEAGSKPGIDALARLARVGNVDLDWLLTGKGEIRPAGLVPGAVFADVLVVAQYELGTSLSIPTLVGKVPVSRNFLETELRLKEPTYDTLLVVEADRAFYDIARGDLVLIDRNQANLASDGVYLLDLPGMTLWRIFRGLGDRVNVAGPGYESFRRIEHESRGRKKGNSSFLEMKRSELLGAGRDGFSKVVGRAVWVSRAI
jgi:transcriptional regulator with XRE-family HTH domain